MINGQERKNASSNASSSNKVEQFIRLALGERGHKLSDNGEFDPGSGRTLAACFIHASRTRI